MVGATEADCISVGGAKVVWCHVCGVGSKPGPVRNLDIIDFVSELMCNIDAVPV